MTWTEQEGYLISTKKVKSRIRLLSCGLSSASDRFLCFALCWVSDSKESAYQVGDPGSIPRSERSPGEGNGYPLQYSCLENSRDRGAWKATVHGVAQSQT